VTAIPSTDPYAAGVDDAATTSRTAVRTGWMAVAGLASIGAGAIHAAAIGVHAEHKSAAITFVVLAALQLAWGVLAVARSSRLVAALGIAVNVGAIVGWVWAKVWGISLIAGLDEAEPVQTADGLAAGLAAASVLLIGFALWTERRDGAPARPPMAIAALGLTGLSIFGMIAAGTHSHAEGHGAAGDHHGGENTTIVVEQPATGPAVVVPFDPTQPIDFSGAPDTTPEQQAFAENLVATTLNLLPMWEDPEFALANGFRTIGDGGTGTEHFINDEFRNDDSYFDPTRPESLVWDTTSGERELVAAMYMLDAGLPIEDVPDYGGSLMQFHIHNNLCYTPSGQVAGLTNSEGECAPGLILPEAAPMVHVWLENQPCGPFSALEGIGGGQIAEGETVNCDHAHGTS
jgi:hypothetical protein